MGVKAGVALTIMYAPGVTLVGAIVNGRGRGRDW